MSKRRKIRYDRLALVVLAFTIILSSIGLGVTKLVSFIIDEVNASEIIESELVEELSPEEIIIEAQPEEEVQPERKEQKKYLGEFLLTGYCNCKICCGEWAGGPCYNGEMPEEGWTIAVDPNIIPINSLVEIDGVIYKAQDTGSAIIGKHVDVFCNHHEDCFAEWCNGYHEVYLIIE